MGIVYVVQHGEKERTPGDPGLTGRGRAQAALAAEWLRDKGLRAVYASPLLRARQTAAAVAAVAGLPMRVDARVAERMNWDGSVPAERFFADWVRATEDRDFIPAVGDSSRAAGERFREFLVEDGADGPIAVACHGGVTVDLLRTLMGDAAVPEALLRDGVPSGAITTLDGLRPVAIAETGHLAGLATGHRPVLSLVGGGVHRLVARAVTNHPYPPTSGFRRRSGDRSLGPSIAAGSDKNGPNQSPRPKRPPERSVLFDHVSHCAAANFGRSAR